MAKQQKNKHSKKAQTKTSSRFRWLGGLLVAAFVIGAILVSTSRDLTPLSISWVSTDRSVFKPSEESVRVRFEVSASSSVTLSFIDPYERIVRKLELDVEEPGQQELIWDGRDEKGDLLPSEAYAYTITAARGNEEVVWDPRGRTGGEPIRPRSTEWDRKTGKLVYALPEASRVRVLLAKRDTGWHFRTLVDWKPRPAGKNTETWDGWDADRVIDAREIPGLVPVISAYQLPENVVLVQGQAETPLLLEETELVPQRVQEKRSGHLHARHPRAMCFERSIEMSVDEALNTVEVSVPSGQGPARVRPLPRASVFIYVDGKIVHRELDATLPYRSYLEGRPSGEHILSVLVTWRENHMGMKHQKVRWP